MTSYDLHTEVLHILNRLVVWTSSQNQSSEWFIHESESFEPRFFGYLQQ